MKGFELPREVVAKASSSLRRVLSQHGSCVVRFGLVGVSGLLVNYALLYLLVGVGGVNHLAAAVLATEGAILSNFTFNNRWTFGDVQPPTTWIHRAYQYNFFCLGGLVISVVALAMLTYVLHLHYLMANIFAIVVATLWNYTANRYWTWPTTSLTHETEAIVKGEV